MKIAILYVFYNRKCENICLPKACSFDYDIYIYDNSTSEEIAAFNKNCALSKGFLYYGDGKNRGLSVAYNIAIEQMTDVDYITLFDDDTKVPPDYFIELQKFLTRGAQVIVPRVVSARTPISPSPLKHIGVKSGDRNAFTAINTGMTISKRVFDVVGMYDETIFLDYIDHNFCLKLFQNNIPIDVMDATLVQDFSSVTCTDKKSALTRFKIFQKDFKVFCKNANFSKFYTEFRILRRLLKLTAQFKSLEFFRYYYRGEK